MPDVLTHVLVAYAVAGTAARRGPLPDRYVSLACLGATMPDVMKAAVVAGTPLGALSGIAYSFWGVHTVGGVLALGGLGALTIRPDDRRSAFAVLSAAGAGHLLLDLLVIRVDGSAPPYLFPFTGWLPPAGNLYASSDVWPAAVAIAIALPVFVGRARRDPDGG